MTWEEGLSSLTLIWAMTKHQIEQKRVELDEIDLGFCLLCIHVEVNACGFTQQLGDYKEK